ncbi:hypothetical protein D9615_009051 [Tricholomella constricta]|uniref:CCHC-type domain-containing protein n=1 Tax=Tricholomella constricta TaxID=117010 RepID=A0A8H5GZY3_9AGAR|nr:hypothetical protein D9615_009051 [Tricholomella constricta]
MSTSPIAESFADISPPSADMELDSAELVEAPVSTHSPARSYSSVVRSGLGEPRSPSPGEENQETVPSWNDITKERNRLECRSWAQCREDEQRENEARFRAAEARKQEQLRELGGQWHTVSNRRPRARSLEGPEQLTKSQADTVRQAEEGMDPTQLNLLRRREQATRVEEGPEARGVGPSKGKNPDPRNWGAAGIPAEELEVAAQQAALEEYESIRVSPVGNVPVATDRQSASVNRELMKEIESLRAELNDLRKAAKADKKKKYDRKKAKAQKAKKARKQEKGDMRPSTQITPSSYLGVAFRNISDGPSEDSSGSSGSSSSDSDSDEDSSSSSSSDSSSDTDSSDSTTGSESEPKALWRERLNPEESRWDHIVEAAEIHEIAEAVEVGPSRNPKKPNQSPSQNTGGGSGSRRFASSGQRFGNREQSRTDDARSKEPVHRTGPNGGKTERRPKPPTNNQTNNHDHLSKQRKDELRAQNKCFKCYEVGHTARNCPDNQQVKSPGNGPPGVANFSLEMRIDETEKLRSLAETTESVETLELGMITMQEDIEHDNPSRPYIHAMGDPLAERATKDLTDNQPYPGDWTEGTSDRFLIYRVAGGRHVIFDHMMDYDDLIEDVLIPSAFLEDGAFDVVQWYTQQMSKRLWKAGEYSPDATEELTEEQRRDPLAERAEEVLQSGAPYPGDVDNPEHWGATRFEVWRDHANGDIHSIYDKLLDFHRSA